MTFPDIDQASVRLAETGEEEIWIEGTQWSTIPMTSGMEVEQYDDDICYALRDKYDWHYDGSGPLETALEPSIAPLTKIKEFIDFVLDNNCEWDWKGFYLWYSDCRFRVEDISCEAGCGSHIHFRPRPAEHHKQNPKYRHFPGLDKDPPYPHPETVSLEDVWATAYNTLIEVYPFIIPLFVYGNSRAPIYKPRSSILTWAEFVSRRYSPEVFYENFMSEDYYGHPYHAVALNRKTENKPLTIEIRLNESHPAIAYFTIILLNRIVRKVFDRGYLSPKLEMTESDRISLYNYIADKVYDSSRYRADLYTALESAVEKFVHDYGPIRFVKGREIPGCKREYDSYFKLFRDIIYNNSHWMNPVEHRISQLFIRKGNPSKNSDKLWRIFRIPKGQFCWNDPEWCEKT